MIEPGKWERRWHPLRETWVVYAAHRNNRPWTVAKQDLASKPAPAYDPNCYLCPGNQRISGASNPDYQDIFIFENDHPVLGVHAPGAVPPLHTVYQSAEALGTARVICYSPLHNLSMAEMPLQNVVKVFEAWRSQTIEIGKISGIENLLIFENKGEIVGVSNPHPHGQIYAGGFTFTVIQKYLEAVQNYKTSKGRNLFEDIVDAEREGVRIIAENQNAIAFIPYFGRFAYETLVFPKKQHLTLATVSDTELEDLAAVYLTTIRKMDGLFGMSFPYNMTINQAPYGLEQADLFWLHWQILPPLRHPDLKKFFGGPEVGVDTFMADTMPEEKAAELRAVSITFEP